MKALKGPFINPLMAKSNFDNSQQVIHTIMTMTEFTSVDKKKMVLQSPLISLMCNDSNY